MNKEKNRGEKIVALVFFLAEALFLIFLFSLFPSFTLAIVGQDNVTVTTNLTVGNAAPEIINITLVGATTIDLTPNATTTVTFLAIIRDFNGEGDIDNVTSIFYDNVASSEGAADDNNDHYTNASCVINTAYGNALEANATCIFEVEYYANNATWNITAEIRDSVNLQGENDNIITINSLLALGLPDNIDFGVVNSSEVSFEREANVTNFGNTIFNLSLSGYGSVEGDGFAMNCSLGNNISIEHQKYNLTDTNLSVLNLAQVDSIYQNLTSTVGTREYNLDYRRNDPAPFVDDTNSTFWRIFVPIGVGGSCNGNIIFGAAAAAGS